MKDRSKLFSEEKFWVVIDTSKVDFDNQENQCQKILDLLKDKSVNELMGFSYYLKLQEERLYTTELWAVAEIVCGGASDDVFEYFRRWVISKGKMAFYKTLENVDNLIEYLSEDEFPNFEDLDGIASSLIEEKTGEDYYGLLETEYEYGIEISEIEFNWEEDDEDSLKKICPKIFQKFHKYPIDC